MLNKIIEEYRRTNDTQLLKQILINKKAYILNLLDNKLSKNDIRLTLEKELNINIKRDVFYRLFSKLIDNNKDDNNTSINFDKEFELLNDKIKKLDNLIELNFNLNDKINNKNKELINNIDEAKNKFENDVNGVIKEDKKIVNYANKLNNIVNDSYKKLQEKKDDIDTNVKKLNFLNYFIMILIGMVFGWYLTTNTTNYKILSKYTNTICTLDNKKGICAWNENLYETETKDYYFVKP